VSVCSRVCRLLVECAIAACGMRKMKCGMQNVDVNVEQWVICEMRKVAISMVGHLVFYNAAHLHSTASGLNEPYIFLLSAVHTTCRLCMSTCNGTQQNDDDDHRPTMSVYGSIWCHVVPCRALSLHSPVLFAHC